MRSFLRLTGFARFNFLIPLILAAAPAFAQSGTIAGVCNQPAKDPITNVSLKGNPRGVLATRDGCWIFVTTANPSGVTVLRRRDGVIESSRVVPTASEPTELVLTHDQKTLIVESSEQTMLMDVEKLTSGHGDALLGLISDRRFGGPDIGVGITSDDRLLFLSQTRTNWLNVLDFQKLRSLDSSSSVISDGAPDSSAIQLVVSPDDRYLYVTNMVAPLMRSGPAVCHSADPPAEPEGSVFVIDIQQAKSNPMSAISSSVRAGCGTDRLALSPDGKTLYVTARQDKALLAFDTRRVSASSSLRLIGGVPLGSAPRGVAVINGGKKVVVARSGNAENPAEKFDIVVIDAAKITMGKGAVLGTIPTGSDPRKMAVTADGRNLLLPNFASRTLEVIDMDQVKLSPVRP